jgi:CBS domain-containing protein
MTRELIFDESKMDLGEAAKLMFQIKIKKLPVVKRERLVGLLS